MSIRLVMAVAVAIYLATVDGQDVREKVLEQNARVRRPDTTRRAERTRVPLSRRAGALG